MERMISSSGRIAAVFLCRFLMWVSTVRSYPSNSYPRIRHRREQAPGTPFEELPDDWVCPLCGVGRDGFVPV